MYALTRSICDLLAICRYATRPLSEKLSGTESVGSMNRSVAHKRSHEHLVNAEGGDGDCPVCLDPIPRARHTQMHLGIRSFQCTHALCRTCDRNMQRVGDNRCPTCRAPRKGMSVTDAEPSPDRNITQEGEWESFSVWSLEQSGFEPIFTRGRDGRLVRPDTGHTMFFPVQPPTSLVDGNVTDVLRGGAAIDERTRVALSALSGILPFGLVEGLLDPGSVSISEWHAIRARGRPTNRDGPVHAPPFRQSNRNGGRRRPEQPNVHSHNGWC